MLTYKKTEDAENPKQSRLILKQINNGITKQFF